MNYTASASLKQMFCHEFVQLFEAQYPAFRWTEVQADIFRMIKGSVVHTKYIAFGSGF